MKMHRVGDCAVLSLTLLIAAASAQTKPPASRPGGEVGTVTGTVYDSQTGTVIRGASVTVTETGIVALTDLDGAYTLKLPPGTYTLKASKDGYFEQPIEQVLVEARKILSIDPVLVPRTVLSERVEVTADSFETASVKSVLLERKMAQTISDSVSAEDIGKNPDSDAAGILERVTGISVVQDKYIFVRGLGERYSNTMLNGSVIPSTEPERKQVAFDMFPSSLINKISTLKSFTPDQPGDFSGGLVKVETVQFPAEFTLKYSASIGFDSNVMGEDFLSYGGSHLDWLGFGARSRRLPDLIPPERVTKTSAATGKGFTPEELQRFGRSFRNQWSPSVGDADPNFSQTIMGGGTYKNLGSIFSMTYSRKFQRQLETVNSYQALGGQLIPYNLFTNDKNTENIKMGFVGNVAYKLSKNHKLQLKNFYTRDSNDETRLLEGYSEGNTADERDYRLRYSEETIFTSQASGEHYLSRLKNGLLEWRMGYSRATREEPDMREVIYRSEQDKNDFFFASQGQSGFRQFTGQFDRILEPGLDWSNFFVGQKVVATIKVGTLYHDRTRDFSSRRFVFLPFGRNLDFRLPPEQIFAGRNLGPDSIELREITRSTDTYDASHKVYAGYGMADVTVGRWRFLGGVRYEDSRQHLITFDPFAPDLTPTVTDLNNTDFLPSASVVFTLARNMNLRAGYSRTVNRPEFREMAPFQFTDISGRSTLFGNPKLQQSRIHNADVRWEWFGTGDDLLAGSFFWKEFDKPIERVLFYAADVLTSFYNTDNARNKGIELEARKNLGFITDRLGNFSLYGNYSRIGSRVTIGDIPGLILTSHKRPLQGQANYIFNSVLEFTHPGTGTDFRILYNLVGRRISEVGATLQPDVYERPNHFLDVSFAQKLKGFEHVQFKFSVQNLLDRPLTHLQGDQVFYRYKMGRVFSIGFNYDIY